MSRIGTWLYGPLTVGVALGAGFVLSSSALRLMPVPPPLPEVPQITPPATPRSAAEDAAPQGWPALFGTPEPPAPPPPPPKEPPPAPPPTELVVPYVLKGLIAGARDGWAILSDGSSDQLVRVGDQTSGGQTVEAITAKGVMLRQGALTALVTFDPADSTALASEEGAAEAETPAASPQSEAAPAPAPTPSGQAGTGPIARPLPGVTLNMSEFQGERLARIVTRAGGVAETQLKDGTPALEILWVRNGLLYDRISLIKGDKVTTINGRPIVQAQNSAEVLQALVQARSFEIEFVRNGVLRSLRIEVQDAD